MDQYPTRSFPLRCFKVILIAAVSLYILLGVLLLAAYRQSRNFHDRALFLDELIDDLRCQMDTMNTMALLGAATGEQVFTARYREHLATAWEDLRRLATRAPRPAEQVGIDSLKRQMPSIIDTQQQALGHAARGELPQAWAVLRGLEYEQEQKNFANELDGLDRFVERRLADNLTFQKLYTSIAIWCIVIFAPILLVVSLLLLRLTRRHIDSDNKSQLALLETMRTLEALLDATSDRILLLDWSGRIISVNTAGAEGFGASCDTLRGRNFFTLLPESVAANRREWMRQVMATGKPARFSDSRDGVVFDNIIAPLPDASGVPRGAALFARDVTDLHRAREKAEAANRAKDAFLATMSHEIRTPLNGILGMAQVLEGTELTASQRQYLADIMGESNTLLSLVNAILELSQLEAGAVETQSLPFTVESVTQPMVMACKHEADAKGLRLLVSLADDVPELIVGDGERLREALEHLACNAVKFTEAGEVAITITRDRRFETEGKKRKTVDLLFSIRDTGIGIAPSDQTKIFDSFVQVDSSATRRHGGTGLGLAIASRLIASLGGTITVESQPGQGSLFSFTLRFDLPDEE